MMWSILETWRRSAGFRGYIDTENIDAETSSANLMLVRMKCSERGDVCEIGAMGSELGQRRRCEFSVRLQEHDGKDFREESDCTWPF